MPSTSVATGTELASVAFSPVVPVESVATGASFVAATLTETEVELLLPAASVTAKFTVRVPAVGVSDVLSNFTDDNKLVNAA